MFFMNEYEVENARRQFGDDTPNLARGARVLARLVDWTNRNSDGWAYWPKPVRAAGKLQEVLSGDRYSYNLYPEDITDAELRKLFTPIKSFLTRQGVDHTIIFHD